MALNLIRHIYFFTFSLQFNTTNQHHKRTIHVHHRLQVFVPIYDISDFPHGQVSVFITLYRNKKNLTVYVTENNNKNIFHKNSYGVTLYLRQHFPQSVFVYSHVFIKQKINSNFQIKLNKPLVVCWLSLYFRYYTAHARWHPASPNAEVLYHIRSAD